MVIVSLKNENEELGKDIAMHIAASSPLVVNPEDVDVDLLSKERVIISAQVSGSDKPKEIIEKMVSGRLDKFLSEVSLINKLFVKDPSEKISSLLSKSNNKVISYVRYEVGEGIEVEKKDFAKDSKMIHKKQSKMAKMGHKIYNKQCEKTDMKFASIAKAKAYILRNKLCKDINGKQLQAVGLYLHKR